jgi:hypothetical protein
MFPRKRRQLPPHALQLLPCAIDFGVRAILHGQYVRVERFSLCMGRGAIGLTRSLLIRQQGLEVINSRLQRGATLLARG